MVSIVIADRTRAYAGPDLETRPLGGTESSVVRLARALAARRHDVTVLTPAAGVLEDRGVRWAPLAGPLPEDVDLYLPVHQTDLLGLVRRPRRLALWILWPASQLRHYKRLPAMWRHRPVPVLTSRYDAGRYSPLLPPRNPLIVIPLGLPDDIRGLPPLEHPPPPRAVFASNPTRNLFGLIRIWVDRILPAKPDAMLDVYGVHGLRGGDDPWTVWGPDILPRDVPAVAKASIRFHPTASRDELMAAVRASRVMLYLGHKAEAFCLAVAEAQAMGVPAGVAPVTVLPERVVDGVTGFIRADPVEFAKAALALLSDDGLWRRQHEAALRLQQGLSWVEVAERLEAALLSDMIPTTRSWSDEGP